MYEINQNANRGRRRVVVIVLASIVAGVLLVVVGVYAGIQIAGGGKDPAAQGQPTSSADPDDPSTRTGDNTEDNTGDSTADRLQDVHWATWQGLALPVSSQHGPLEQDADRASGFTHDTPGAVLAAIHVTIRSQQYAGPEVFRPTIAEQMTGADKDAYLAAMESAYEADRLSSGRPAGSPLPQPQIEFLGWKVETGTDQVPVHLLISQEIDGTQRCVDARLVAIWSGRDWQIEAPPNGDGSSVMSEVPCGTSGYTLIPRQG